MVKGILDWNVIQLASMSLPVHLPHSVPEILRDPVARWWERAGRDGALPGIYAALPGALQAELPRLVAASEFAASALIRDPHALAWVSRHIEPPSARAANADYHQRVAAAATAADAQRILREWRRREMLRIAWRDIAGRAGVADTLRALSELADGCIRAAAAAAQTLLETPFGRPRTADGAEVPLIVIGMGKLGGDGAQFLFRRRSGVSLRAGRPNRRRARDRERGVFHPPRPRIDSFARCAYRRRFRVSGRHAAAALRRERAAGREPRLARGLPAAARPRLGAVRVDQGAGDRRCRGLRRREPGVRAPVRLSPLSRFRGVRVAARHEGADRARSGAPRSRAGSQARSRADPRDRVHRAVDAAGARRQRPSAAECRAAGSAAAAGRFEIVVRGGRRRAARLPISRCARRRTRCR